MKSVVLGSTVKVRCEIVAYLKRRGITLNPTTAAKGLRVGTTAGVRRSTRWLAARIIQVGGGVRESR